MWLEMVLASYRDDPLGDRSGVLPSIVGNRFALACAGRRWLRRRFEEGVFLGVYVYITDVFVVTLGPTVLDEDPDNLTSSSGTTAPFPDDPSEDLGHLSSLRVKVEFPQSKVDPRRPALMGLRMAQLLVETLVEFGEREGLGPPPLWSLGAIKVRPDELWTILALGAPSEPEQAEGTRFPPRARWRDDVRSAAKDAALASWAQGVLANAQPSCLVALTQEDLLNRGAYIRDQLLDGIGTRTRLIVPKEWAGEVHAWLITPA